MSDVQKGRVRLWKDHRIIEKNGLVKCQKLERGFYNSQCAMLIEDLISVYRQKGLLPIHYAYCQSLGFSPENETITYKCYKDWVCIAKATAQRVVGQFYIHYRIIRLQTQTTLCKYPYLLLFNTVPGYHHSQDGSWYRPYKVTGSSIYVIRMQFVCELIRKITFMNHYPRYIFTPYNFVSNQSNGDTVYEVYQDFYHSLYEEHCETFLAKLIKLELIKRQMDCETIGFHNLCPEDSQLIENVQKKMYKHSAKVKLRYICRKCPGMNIWTERRPLVIHYRVYKLKTNFTEWLQMIKPQDKKQLIEGSKVEAEYRQLYKAQEQLTSSDESQAKTSIQTLYNVQSRFLDRSIQRDYEELKAFQQKTQGYYAFHQKVEDYKWPYLIAYSIKIPKKICTLCQVQKDGLIYVTSLLLQAQTLLNERIINTIKEMHQKKGRR